MFEGINGSWSFSNAENDKMHPPKFINKNACEPLLFPNLQAELCLVYCTHRVISDKVHNLLVTLSYFRPDRFVQLLSLMPILILLLYLLVSIDLVYTGLREFVPEWEQLYSKFNSNCSGVETTSSFNTLQINRLLVLWNMIG